MKVARAWSGLLCGTREPVAPIGRPASGAVLACGWSSGARTPSSRSARGRVVMRGTGADLTRISDEGPVMGPERRGRVVRARSAANRGDAGGAG